MLFDFLCPETALLDGLSQFKPQYDFTVCPDVTADKYIAASALQKALRRKNLKQAMFAAAVLKRIDEGYLFRRLKCCALEDVGPADLDPQRRGSDWGETDGPQRFQYHQRLCW